MDPHGIIEIVIPDDKDSICRFCLKISMDLIAINDYSQDIKWLEAGNLSIQLFTKLCLKIDNAECLPNKICDKCKTCLDDFLVFVDKIESNEEILRKVYSEDVFSSSEKEDISNLSFEDHKECLNSESIENSSDSVIDYEHAYEQTFSGLENCEGGQILNIEKSNLLHSDDLPKVLKKNSRISIQKHDKSSSTKVESKLGDNEVKGVTMPALNKRENLVLKHKAPWKMEDEPFCIKQCFFCDRKFSNDDLRTLHYLEHVVQATEDIVSYRPFCSYCGLLTGTKKELDEHIISKHQNEKYLNCADCKIRFSNIDEVTKHAAKEHKENFEEELYTKSKCLICKEVFSDIDNMMKHSLEHISRRHTCLTCKNIYICDAALNEHHRTHPEYKRKCPICKKLIGKRMQQHIHSHNTIRNLECQICKKRYSSKTHFNYHMKCHSRPNNICPHCAYATKYTKDFVMHMRTHTNERPFKCTFENCGKTYKTNSTLSMHVKAHLNIKNFACEFCDYKTSRSVGLTIHRRIHTGEKPYSCKFCGKNFNRQWSLTVHLKKLHPQ